MGDCPTDFASAGDQVTTQDQNAHHPQVLTEVHQRFIDTGIQEIARNGYAGANINTISLSAGFAKGTIYNYFMSKQDLMFAILEQSASDHLGFIAETIGEDDHPVKRLKRFFEAGFKFVEASPARGQVLISTIYGPHPAFKERLYQAYRPMFELVADQILAPGIAQGLFREMEILDTSVMIMNIYLGTASNVDPDGRPWIDHEKVSGFVLHSIRRIP